MTQPIDTEQPIAISVKDLSKTFRLPHERNTSVKSTLINVLRGGDLSYEKLHALKNVTFDVRQGEFFGIVGRNGSGKSTLLKLLAGIYTPTAGDVQVNGKLTPFIELGVGFNPELTGRENVFLNGALLGFTRKEMQAMYKDIVDFAELHRFMDQKLKNYSTGMQVRLAFSIAIQVNTDILVLDEVLAVGDAAFQKKCMDFFDQLKKERQTVILVSHDMSSIEEHCTKAVLIHDGSIIDFGDPRKIAAKYRLINMSTSTAKIKTDLTEIFNEVVIEEVTVNGREEAIIEPSHDITIEIDYTPKNTKSLITSISIIRDKDNQHIAYFDSRDDTKTLDHKKGQKYQAVCKLQTNQFLGGTYQVDVDFRDKNDIYLAQKLNAVHFSITSTSSAKAGTFNLQGDWKIKKL